MNRIRPCFSERRAVQRRAGRGAYFRWRLRRDGPGGEQPVHLRLRSPRQIAACVRCEEGAPTLDRFRMLGYPEIKLLVDPRRRRRIDGRDGSLRLRSREGSSDENVDLGKRWRLDELFQIQRFAQVKTDSKPRRQNGCLLDKRLHRTASRSPPPPRVLNYRPAQFAPGLQARLNEIIPCRPPWVNSVVPDVVSRRQHPHGVETA